MSFSIVDLVHEIARRRAAAPAFIHGDTVTSWTDVGDQIDRLAAVLHDAGIGGAISSSHSPHESPHDHVGIMLPNRLEYLVSVVATHQVRGAPFNMNYRYTPSEVQYILEDSRAAALIYDAEFGPTVRSALAQMASTPTLIEVGGKGASEVDAALPYETSLEVSRPLGHLSEPSADDLHVVYTGGTTGRPKGVLWRVGDLLAGPLGMRRKDGAPFTTLDEALDAAGVVGPTVLPAPPLMHGAGLWFALGAWCSGGTVVVPADTTADALVEALCTHQVESIMLVGDAMGRPLAERLEEMQTSLPNLRHVFNSGAAMTLGLKDRFAVLLPGVRVVDVLGASETGPQASRRDDTASFARQQGVAVLSADRTHTLMPGSAEVGWLAKSGAIPRGYLNDASKTSETFVVIEDIRYAIPGDRVSIDGDGSIRLLGRDSQTVNSGGEKIFVEEVEDCLRSIAAVADALVLGRPSVRWGEELVALVAIDPEGPTDREIKEELSLHLARYKLPKAMYRVPLVRRLENGKADYAWARATLLAETGESTHPDG